MDAANRGEISGFIFKIDLMRVNLLDTVFRVRLTGRVSAFGQFFLIMIILSSLTTVTRKELFATIKINSLSACVTDQFLFIFLEMFSYEYDRDW